MHRAYMGRGYRTLWRRPVGAPPRNPRVRGLDRGKPGQPPRDHEGDTGEGVGCSFHPTQTWRTRRFPHQGLRRTAGNNSSHQSSCVDMTRELPGSNANPGLGPRDMLPASQWAVMVDPRGWTILCAVHWSMKWIHMPRANHTNNRSLGGRTKGPYSPARICDNRH